METELEKNRKDGFLAKKRFIDNVSELEYQQKKQGQKENRKMHDQIDKLTNKEQKRAEEKARVDESRAIVENVCIGFNLFTPSKVCRNE